MKKKLLILILTVSMGLCACGAETSVEVEIEEETQEEVESETEETAGYVKGSVTEAGWESEWLGISYTCPEGMFMLAEEQMNEAMGLGQEILSEDFQEEMNDYVKQNIVCEMLCKDESGITSVGISVEKLFVKMTAEQYIESVEKNLAALEVISYEIVNSGEVVEIGGVEFSKIECITDYEGVVEYQNYFATIKDDRAVSIVVTYSDETEATVDAIMNGFVACAEAGAERETKEEAREEKTGFVKGTLTETGWESEWIGIRYIRPEGTIMFSEEQMNEGLGAEVLAEDFSEEQLDYRNDDGFEMICIDESGMINVLVCTEKLTMEMTAEQYIEGLEKLIKSTRGVPYEIVNSGEVIKIGGIEFTKMEVMAGFEGNMMYQRCFVTVKEDTMVSIQVSYPERAEVMADTIINGFSACVEAGAEEMKDYVRGTLTEAGWESEWLGIRYICPEGMIMLTEEMYEAWGYEQEVPTDEQRKFEEQNIVNEMICSDEFATTKIIVCAVKILKGVTTEQFMESYKKQLVEKNGASTEIINDGEVVEIGGVQFTKLECVTGYRGIVVRHQDYFVTVKEDRLIMIAALYFDETAATADAMMKGFVAY